ncbi:hypothetical protein OPT61_g4691 [Boeremia exigua]|uniref:Uncharacterized protein n=1 Tax=Boeremia exigua TaxID=749465 RepID=A0ACC2IDC8_9PLEO|nr:hypothetical protein OPT61_g4691 [Boeremia exigua]
MKAVGTKNARMPLAMDLFERLCLCSGVVSAAVRESSRQSEHETHDAAAAVVPRTPAPGAHGKSRTGLSAGVMALLAGYGVRRAASPYVMHTGVSPCTLIHKQRLWPSSARSAPAVLQQYSSRRAAKLHATLNRES